MGTAKEGLLFKLRLFIRDGKDMFGNKNARWQYGINH